MYKNKKIIWIKCGAAIFLLLSSLTNAVFGYYLGKIIDSISEGNKKLFLSYLLVAAIAIVFGMICSMSGWACAYYDACYKAKILKNKIFNYELKKSRSQNIDISKFSNKMDLVYNDDYLHRWLIYNNLLLFVFSCIAIIFINWIMLFVAILVSVIPMLMPNLFSKYVQKAANNFSNGSSKYSMYVNNILQGRLEIIKYGVIKKFCENHDIENFNFEISRFKNRVANRNSREVTNTVGNIATMGIFLIGGILAFHGLMEVGGVIGVIQLMNNVVGPVIDIADSRNQINACKPIVKELNEEVPAQVNHSKMLNLINQKNQVILKANHIFYRYSSTDEEIINGFEYQFEYGKKYLIQGESGSGKTTLAKLLTGELQPEKGNVEINNISIHDLSEEELIQIMTYVDQKVYMFNDTIINNIILYRDIDSGQVDKIMDSLRIQALDKDKIINDDNGISGGQKARVCLARATVVLPKILFVDEPTAALDTGNSYRVMEYLCSLPITVIVISHTTSQEISKLFDEVINL